MNQIVNNKKNTNIVDSRIIVIILVCAAFLLTFYILIFKINPTNIPLNNNRSIKDYNIHLPKHQDAINKNLCPSNCVRGRCNVKLYSSNTGKSCLNNDCSKQDEQKLPIKKENTIPKCKYDFQCQYCKDSVTNQFYVDNVQSRKIIPLLEEESDLDSKQKDMLNTDINSYNNYIKTLNKNIEKHNKKI